jgi:hypothetical protein
MPGSAPGESPGLVRRIGGAASQYPASRTAGAYGGTAAPRQGSGNGTWLGTVHPAIPTELTTRATGRKRRRPGRGLGSATERAGHPGQVDGEPGDEHGVDDDRAVRSLHDDLHCRVRVIGQPTEVVRWQSDGLWLLQRVRRRAKGRQTSLPRSAVASHERDGRSRGRVMGVSMPERPFPAALEADYGERSSWASWPARWLDPGVSLLGPPAPRPPAPRPFARRPPARRAPPPPARLPRPAVAA